MTVMENVFRRTLAIILMLVLAALGAPAHGSTLSAQQPAVATAAPATILAAVPQAAPQREGGEANLVIPDLGSVEFFGVSGKTLLYAGLAVCALGLLFGLTIYTQLKNMAVHESMRAISELI